MHGGERDSMEWKEDERTSESAGEWIEFIFMIMIVIECSGYIDYCPKIGPIGPMFPSVELCAFSGPLRQTHG